MMCDFISGLYCLCTAGYMYVSVYILCAYLGCVCFGQAEEEAVEAWNRTEGIDEVTILERESWREAEPKRNREASSDSKRGVMR